MKKKLEKQLARVAALHSVILSSDVFRTDGQPIDLPQAIIDLCAAVHEIDHTDDDTEHMWDAIGEHTEATLGDLIAGAFWTLTAWHAGQYSPEYAALCALGGIYSPGMASGPEPESAEATAAEMLGAWFEARHAAPPFPITLIGDPGHAEAQAATLARLKACRH
jgi:hypothetical protein